MTIAPEKRQAVLAALKDKTPKTFSQIAKQIGGLSVATVRNIALKNGIVKRDGRIGKSKTKIAPEKRQRVLEMLREEKPKTLRQIAKKVGGLSHESVRKIGVEEGIIKPQTRAVASKANMVRLNADPEFAAKHAAAASERMKRLRADPEFAAAASEGLKRLHADPEFAAAASERMKRLHADPEFAAAASERMKRLNADPEFAAKNAAAASERMKKRHADPEFSAKLAAAASEGLKRLHADPEFAAKHAAASSERMKKRHAAKRLLKTEPPAAVPAAGHNSLGLGRPSANQARPAPRQ